MNKFITLALFAICATMAHGQMVGWPSQQLYSTNQQSSGSTGSAASAASAAAASTASTSDASNTHSSILNVNPLSSYPVIAGPYANILAPQQGWVNPILGNPWVQQYPIGLRNVGPCNTGLLY